MLGHTQVHAIDWHHPSRPIGWDDATSYAREHDQRHLISFFEASGNGSRQDQPPVEQTPVRDLLLESSDLASLMESHRLNMDMAQIGHGDNYIGADVILRWYERNMKIFVNINRLTSSAADRVFVLIGGGHLPLLTHFIEGAGRYELAPANPYLS